MNTSKSINNAMILYSSLSRKILVQSIVHEPKRREIRNTTLTFPKKETGIKIPCTCTSNLD